MSGVGHSWYGPAMATDAPHPKTVAARLSRAGLWALRGWKFEGEVPSEPHLVMLAGPHTSNMDGLLLVLLTRSVGMSASWMVKDTWSKPPMGWLIKPVGAVPVDRSKANGMVGQMVEEFAKRDHFHLMIPPEGTRSYTEHWKSGFYRIALAADVPIAPSFLDYKRRRGGFGESFRLTGDKRKDMDKLREFYKDGAEMARYPDKYGPIRLRDEDED